MTLRPTRPYAFGRFCLDRDRLILSRDGVPLALEPKVLETLLVLIENRGLILSREDLIQQVWRGVIVEEGGLTRNISVLRKVLGERPNEHRYIVTSPGRGYQFVAEVQEQRVPIAFCDRAPETSSSRLVSAVGKIPSWVSRRKLSWIAVVVGAVCMGGLASHWQSRGGFSERDPPAKLLRLTATRGYNGDPALSRDGALLAYASDRAGRQDLDIWVQTLGGGEPVQRTFGEADETDPSFSPDGSQIVYSRRDSGIYVIGTLSGQPQLVASIAGARTPRFSPDGKWIAFWTGFAPAVVAGGIPGALGEMHVAPAAGGVPRTITTALPSERFPIWSPDGGHLLFLGEENADLKTHDWYLIPKEGGTPVKTGALAALRREGLGKGIPIPGAWRAADRKVVFATNEGATSNIWEIPLDPATGRVLGPPRRLTFGAARERSPAISDSGGVVFTSVFEDVGIWRLPINANSGVVTGELEHVTDGAGDVLRNISTNGTHLTFLSQRTGRQEVWSKNLDSGAYRQVTFTGASDASADAWGGKVAFSGSDASRSSIEIAGARSDAVAPFCQDCIGPSDWLADGSRLLFGVGLPSAVVLHDFRSGRQTTLARHEQWTLEMARFSPDGRWVAFHAALSPNVRRIYAVPAASGDFPLPADTWTMIVTDHGCHPNWSPDGSLLYYFSFRDGHFCLYAQRLDPLSLTASGPPLDVRHFHSPTLRAAAGVPAYNDIQDGYVYLNLTESMANIWTLR